MDPRKGPPVLGLPWCPRCHGRGYATRGGPACNCDTSTIDVGDLVYQVESLLRESTHAANPCMGRYGQEAWTAYLTGRALGVDVAEPVLEPGPMTRGRGTRVSDIRSEYDDSDGEDDDESMHRFADAMSKIQDRC